MNKQSRFLYGLLVIWILLVLFSPSSAQQETNEDKIWASFKAWVMSNPVEVSLKVYANELAKKGIPKDEIQKQLLSMVGFCDKNWGPPKA